MSWQLAVFSLLGVVLLAGFASYEQSRPSARLIGLVAALAALAAAGRVALTPIPNVTPTTDIALLSGYSLGGPAGFAIGALAAFVSNFWLGQGPWTPWQMAAWGIAGLIGAALARASGRRLGRFGLALACGLAGLLYGALLDLSVMVTYGGEQSLDRYLALSARGLPFNLAHAAGNFAFALAAGPAFVRILGRFRSRLEFAWTEPVASPALARAGAAGPALLAAVVVIGSAGGGSSVEASADPGRDQLAAGPAAARRYLERSQNADGGLPAEPGGRSSVAISGWAMLGLEASGRNPLDLRRRGKTPVDFLRSSATKIRSTGDLERTVLALDGAGVDPRSFAGRDLVAELNRRRGQNGSFQGQVNLTAFGILALRATGTPRSSLRGPARWLRRAANSDGGWGFNPGARSESDSTGAAIQGIVAAAGRGRAVARGAAYLRRTQRGDGGWSLAFGGPTNAQSTAWAVQGLLAAGRGAGVSKRPGGATPFDYLAARQLADGHYRYSAQTDQTPVWVTGQALTAVARAPFPLARAPRAGEPGGVSAPTDSEGDTGGAGADSGGKDDAGRKGEKKGGDGRGGDGRHADRGQAGAPVAALEPAATPAAEVAETGSDSGGIETEWLILAGFAILLGGLGTGFLVYRRRLP